jgi:signal transduction histidine kinase
VAGGKVPGAGIGLSIAKAIVEAHGGTISVVSVPNLTTTFRFTLPAEHAMEGNSAQPEQVASL